MNFPAFIGMVIPAASLLAVMLATFLFVKQKGTMDALRDVAATYKSLAEGYKATLDMCEEKMERLEAEVEDLKRTVNSQKDAMGLAIDELIEGFERAGFERKT